MADLVSRKVIGIAEGQKYQDAKTGTGTFGGPITYGDDDFKKHVAKLHGDHVAYNGSFSVPHDEYYGSLRQYYDWIEQSSRAAFSQVEMITTTPIFDFVGVTIPESATKEAGDHSHSVSTFVTGGSQDGGPIWGWGNGTANTAGNHYHNTWPIQLTGIDEQIEIWQRTKQWIVDGGADFAEESDVDGDVVNGVSQGTAHESGDDPTYYTSMVGSTRYNTFSTQDNNTETAPKHVRVRYLIRVNR